MSHATSHFIVVLGREWRNGQFFREPAECLKKQINDTVIISTPDASNLNGPHMMDLMALTYPGPHLFLVRLEEGKQLQGAFEKWQEVFGENISHRMIYVTDGHSECQIRFGKCINNNADLIKQCKNIIKTEISSAYSFGETRKLKCLEDFLKWRREKIDDKKPTETEIYPDRRSHATGDQPLNQGFPRGSGSGKRKQNEHKMTEDMETGQFNGPPVGQQKSPQLTLVLLGESGSGKSASGNTILGKTAFKSKPSSTPVTTECKMWTETICGTEVTVIDTPDFFDEDLKKPSSHIMRCGQLCGSGLCVYLLVIQIGRFTEGERDILKRLEKALQTTVRDRAIILFTHGDDLKSQIDDYVKGTNRFLRELIVECAGSYQVISNSNSQKKEVDKQVKELMGKIVQLVKMTDGVTVFPDYDAEKSGCVIA